MIRAFEERRLFFNVYILTGGVQNPFVPQTGRDAGLGNQLVVDKKYL